MTLSELKKRTWYKLLWCFLLGGLGALSMPPYCSPALFVALSYFWIILTDLEKKWHAPAAGFLFGFGYFLGSVWWVGNALLVGGNPYLWALPLAVCGLQAILASFTMAGVTALQWLCKGRSLPAYLFFVAMMAMGEWARGNLFTGFPWNLFGMAWTHNIMMLQTLSFGGIYFLSLYSIFLFSLFGFIAAGEAPLRVKGAMFAVALASIAGFMLWGKARIDAHPTQYNRDVIVQVVTPDIPQDQKWDERLFWDNYVKTIQATAPAKMDSSVTGKTRLIVLPETALHFAALNDTQARAELTRILKMYPEKTYLLTGLLRRSNDPVTGEESYHNSLVGFDQDLAATFTFDKFHLVPFGEYIPFQKYIPIGPVVSFSGFASGPGPRTIALDGAPPFSPLVCYEVIFPGEVTASPRPEWIVNVTNDAWYGISPGPLQHLGHALYRAIEEGLPVVRSTNTGVSAVIDPYGRLLTQSPLFQPAVQTMNLPSPASETVFARLHNTLFYIAILIFCVPACLRVIRRNKVPV